jgi:hypothetical protein
LEKTENLSSFEVRPLLKQKMYVEISIHGGGREVNLF